MKILMIVEFFPTGKDLKFTGGVEARTYYVAKYLAKKHHVTVLTTKLKGAKDKERLFKINIIRVGRDQNYQAVSGGVLGRLSFVKNSLQESSNIPADIVEGTNFITHFIAARVSRKKKIPSVAWYPDVWIGSWIKNAGLVGLLGEILERLNLKSGFSEYIAISNESKKKLQKFVKSKINLIPCGVDPAEFRGKTTKTDTVLCVSRLARYKNIKDLILAFALLTRQNHRLKLTIVGRGPQENELESLVINLKLQKKVIFKSNLKRQEIMDLFRSSKVFCLPSEVEGFGISVIEAAAAATPYVVSDIAVFKEITKNGQGGLFFRVGDIKDLSDKLGALTTDNKLYAEKSKQAVDLAQNYQWPKITNMTESVYKKALKSETL